MTSVRCQPFCRTQKINRGRMNGKKITPRTITQRNIALKTQINHFCLIWKSKDICFNKAIDELNLDFKFVVNV